MKNDIIIETRSLSKEFPGVKALQDVSVSVRRGSVHALVGENGAGKSTLIKIMTGVYRPDSGDILINGKKTEILSPIQARNNGISVVHQELKLVETLSIAENVFLGHPKTDRLGLVNWKKINSEAQALIDDLGIDLDVTMEVSRLGIAQKQIVEICKALALNASIMIMDEPSATLTEKELECLFSIINNLRDKGITVIYISHRLEEIFKIADMVTVLRDGMHIATVPVSEVDRPKLISLMVGREIGDEYPKEECEIGDIALKVDGLSRNGVINNISFYVRHGEILGFSGLVGSGRTETARCIFAADHCDTGTISINDREVSLKSVEDAISHGIALIPEDRKTQGLILKMDVMQNVSLADLNNICSNGLIDQKKEKSFANGLIGKLQISTPFPEQKVMYLSGGNQQKVVLAKWLAVESDIIILDEPTRGIDVGAKKEIYKLICNMASQGKAIIMISSDMPELIGICDRILVMRDGEVSGIIDRAHFDQERILDLAVS